MLKTIQNTIRKIFGMNFDQIFEHLDLPDKSGNKDKVITSLDEMRGLMFWDGMIGPGGKKFYEE